MHQQVSSLHKAPASVKPAVQGFEHTRTSALQARKKLAAQAPADTSYDASAIQVLEGLEPVRKRPGMYIGSTGQAGLHHLVYEVLDNAIDEVQAGHASRVEVELDLISGWVSVTDDGRGIPTDIHPQTGKSALETVLTVLHAGGKFGGKQSGYTVSGGLHGVGISVVNALSVETHVRVWRGGQQYHQAFSRGNPVGPMTCEQLPVEVSDRNGTQVRFRYDDAIFAADASYDPDVIRARLRELAFLNSNAYILYRVIPGGRSRGNKGREAQQDTSAGEQDTSAGEQDTSAGEQDTSATDVDVMFASGSAGGHPELTVQAADEAVSPDSVVQQPQQQEEEGQAEEGMPTPQGIGEAVADAGDDARLGQQVDGIDDTSYHENGNGNGYPATDNGQASESQGFIAHVSTWQPGSEQQQQQDVQEQDVAVKGRRKRGGGRGSKGRSTATSMEGGLNGMMLAHGWQVFHYGGGLAQFVRWMNQDKQPLHEVLSFRQVVEGVVLDVALQWCAEHSSDRLVGFVNSVRTVDGGTHLDGTRTGITKTINTLAKKAKLLKDGEVSLSGDCIREGLTGIISAQVLNPEFEGQTKTRLGNPEVKRIAESVVSAGVGEWLELHPAALQAVVGKAVTASRAVEAAKKARDLVRRKAVMTRTTLPGKLADCTSSQRDETELFVVEGDSAGGSAKQARDRRTQAILPLRGKILNVERKDEGSMLKNTEIANLIVAMGLTRSEGCQGLRYSKVIILTDADVDGAHIRTLLLTFLFRFCRELFAAGHVYVAVPPLYKVEAHKGAVTWCYDDQQLKSLTSSLAPGTFSVQRFKGLGEMMPDQLWDTTLDPQRRQLRRLTLHDAEKASSMFELLMGNKVGPRRQLIEEHASRFSLLDLDV